MEVPITFGIVSDTKVRVVKGIVTEEDIPVVATVIILNRDTGLKLGRTQSNKNGEYSLLVPEARFYSVIAFHAQKTFDAVIQDLVVPK